MMQRQTHHHPDPSLRPAFAEGVLLRADDLAAEQAYLDWRLERLATRLGVGVISGLDVELHSEGNKDALVIQPGRAVDSRGRQIELTQAWRYDLNVFGLERRSLLGIRFHAEDAALAGSLTEDESKVGRRRLGFRVGFRHDDGEWYEIGKQDRDPSREWWLPLAVLDLGEGTVSPPETRHYAPLGADENGLTIIRELSWRHDGCVPVAAATRLMLRFDRHLLCVPPHEAWTVVIERAAGGEVEAIRSDRLTMRHKRGALELHLSESLRPGDRVRVRLDCAFVLDRHGVPVSGAHLGGRLPTGDGVAGSTFASWFEVAP